MQIIVSKNNKNKYRFREAMSIANGYCNIYPKGRVFINEAILCFPEKKFYKNDERIEMYVYENNKGIKETRFNFSEIVDLDEIR